MNNATATAHSTPCTTTGRAGDDEGGQCGHDHGADQVGTSNAVVTTRRTRSASAPGAGGGGSASAGTETSMEGAQRCSRPPDSSWWRLGIPGGPLLHFPHPPRRRAGGGFCTIKYLTHGWTFDPFLIVTLAIAVWHEIGLAHLAARSRPARNAVRRRNSLYFYAGLVVLDLTVCSPIDHYADVYFYVHQIQHLLLMFAAPVFIVMGAPWLPLIHALPVGLRRSWGRAVLLGRWSSPLRRIASVLSNPWVAIVAFNVDMVAWHVPALFDLAYRNQTVHIWFMHGLMFGTGVLFWLQFVDSYPIRNRLAPMTQVGALFGTNVVMFVIAVTLGMLTATSWYPVYNHLPGVSLSALGDQHLGAGILWVCGDLWCFPAIHRAVRAFLAEDDSRGFDAVLDRLLRGSRVS